MSFSVRILFKRCITYFFQLKKLKFREQRSLTWNHMAGKGQPEFFSFSHSTHHFLLNWVAFSSPLVINTGGWGGKEWTWGTPHTWPTVSQHRDLQKAVYFYQPGYNLFILWACRGQSPFTRAFGKSNSQTSVSPIDLFCVSGIFQAGSRSGRWGYFSTPGHPYGLTFTLFHWQV